MPVSLPPLPPMKPVLSPQLIWLAHRAIDLSIIILVVAIGFQFGNEPGGMQLKVTVDGAP